MLEKLDQLPKLNRDYTAAFSFPNPSRIDRELLLIKSDAAGSGEKIVFKKP